MSTAAAIEGIRQVARHSQHQKIYPFLSRLHYIASQSLQSRPSDWAVELSFGLCRMYIPLEGGLAHWRREVEGRQIVHYQHRQPLASLLKALYRKYIVKR